MPSRSLIRAVLTDSHFLIPLAMFALGVALLVAMH
ncbi:MAG: translocated intimin receptor Tir [Acidobacteriota bacterium]